MSAHTESFPMTRPKKSGFSWKWLLYPAAAILIFVIAKELHLQDRFKQGLDWVGQLGPWGPALFIGLYIVATVLFIPGSALGAAAAFLVGRYLARNAIARKIEGNERFAAIDKAVANEGWKIVGLMRLSPVFPFTLLNYAFGLTRVKLGHYVLASWIGMMPGTVMYVYLGSLAKAASGERTRTTGEWVLYAVGLLATLLVTIFVTRIAKQALAKKIVV